MTQHVSQFTFSLRDGLLLIMELEVKSLIMDLPESLHWQSQGKLLVSNLDECETDSRFTGRTPSSQKYAALANYVGQVENDKQRIRCVRDSWPAGSIM